MQKILCCIFLCGRGFLHYVLLFVLFGCFALVDQGIESQKIKPA